MCKNKKNNKNKVNDVNVVNKGREITKWKLKENMRKPCKIITKLCA